MEANQIVQEYANGPQLLADSMAGLSADQMRESPIEGKWSTLQVLCHLADFEIVYAHRMQLMICQDEPALFDLDQDIVAEKLFYEQRNPHVELELISAIRNQMTSILQQLSPEGFQRGGVHNLEGRFTILSILKRITHHVPHHIEFLHQKRIAILGD